MKKSLIIIILLASINLFCQEYEIAWQKDMPQMSYAQFSKDGQFIYCAVGNEIWKYRSDNGEFISKFDGTGFVKNEIPIYGTFYLSGQGNYLLVCTDSFSIWDIKTEKGVRQIQKINCMDISADEKQLIIADKSSIYKILIFDSLKIKITGVNEAIIYLRVSHNGKMFATASISGSKYYLTLWDTETLTEIKRFELNGYSGTSFIEIKFSWDDNNVGVRTLTPWDVNIFNTKSFEKTVSSADLKKLECFGFDYTSSNKFCFFYIDIMLYIYKKDLISLDSSYSLKASPLLTSSNNLIFTGKALLKPKTVGVNEPQIQNSEIKISPNPAVDYIDINVGAGSKPAHENEIQIFNIFGEKNPTLALPRGEGTGKVLPSGEDLGGVFKIDVSNLPAGVYFIRICDKLEKFVIVK
jgi:hypothetical protein